MAALFVEVGNGGIITATGERQNERCIPWVQPLEEWNISGQSNIGLLKGKVMSKRRNKILIAVQFT